MVLRIAQRARFAYEAVRCLSAEQGVPCARASAGIMNLNLLNSTEEDIMGKGLAFVAGAALGAAAGTVIGVLLAPRSGAETRAMAADMANDAWDSARDMYEQGVDTARSAANDFGPLVDAKTDELRAKVDLARERMDQLREQLNDAIAGGNVTPAADVVVEGPQEAADGSEAPSEA